MANTERFQGAPWFEAVKNKAILIGGAGGLGSWLALWLSRTGCERVGIYDDDSVESHNLGGQCFFNDHIDKLKVEAVHDVCAKMGNTSPYTFAMRFEDSPKKAPIMFSCFDNMAARAAFFKAWKANESRELFIDARIEAEYAFIYTVTSSAEDIAKYEATLKNDDEIEEAMCTYKQTSPIAAYATSRMWQAFVNWCTPGPRMLVFQEVYRGPMNTIKQEGHKPNTDVPTE